MWRFDGVSSTYSPRRGIDRERLAAEHRRHIVCVKAGAVDDVSRVDGLARRADGGPDLPRVRRASAGLPTTIITPRDSQTASAPHQRFGLEDAGGSGPDAARALTCGSLARTKSASTISELLDAVLRPERAERLELGDARRTGSIGRSGRSACRTGRGARPAVSQNS